MLRKREIIGLRTKSDPIAHEGVKGAVPKTRSQMLIVTAQITILLRSNYHHVIDNGEARVAVVRDKVRNLGAAPNDGSRRAKNKERYLPKVLCCF